MYGGSPRSLYTGGLEIQLRETSAAMSGLGYRVLDGTEGVKPDILHLFGANPSSYNLLRNVQPLLPVVVSAVITFNRSRSPLLEKCVSRITALGSTSSSMRKAVLRRSDHIVALTKIEADFCVEAYSLGTRNISIIPNGSNAASVSGEEGSSRYVVIGSIGQRKRQLELIEGWKAHWPVLSLVGPLSPAWDKVDAFHRALAVHANVQWLGSLPQTDVWDLQRTAIATISNSDSEGESLALLDSLRLGRPVIVRSGRQSTAMRTSYGSSVVQYNSIDHLATYIGTGFDAPTVPSHQRPPSWEDVGLKLAEVYRTVSPQ